MNKCNYIDANKLKVEIEKRLDELNPKVGMFGDRPLRDINPSTFPRESELEKVLELIDTLQQEEQSEVDLENEIERYTEETIHLPITHKRTPMDIMESDWVRCAYHFYELGKNSK